MRKHGIHLALILAVLLTGCNAVPALVMPTCPVTTCAPTEDVVPMLAQAATDAVATAYAGLTLAAPTETPLPPSDTPAPTATEGPSETPVPSATMTQKFIPWTATPTATIPVYGCSIISFGTVPSPLKAGQEFDAEWEVKNTGSGTWYTADIDVEFAGGDKLHTGANIYDLRSTVAPGNSYKVVVDMKAPDTDGAYSSTWGIVMSGINFCSLTANISVAK